MTNCIRYRKMMVIVLLFTYSEAPNSERPNSESLQIPEAREFGFQTVFLSFQTERKRAAFS